MCITQKTVTPGNGGSSTKRGVAGVEATKTIITVNSTVIVGLNRACVANRGR